jgi:hypothetical protein
LSDADELSSASSDSNDERILSFALHTFQHRRSEDDGAREKQKNKNNKSELEYFMHGVPRKRHEGNEERSDTSHTFRLCVLIIVMSKNDDARRLRKPSSSMRKKKFHFTNDDSFFLSQSSFRGWCGRRVGKKKRRAQGIRMIKIRRRNDGAKFNMDTLWGRRGRRGD